MRLRRARRATSSMERCARAACARSRSICPSLTRVMHVKPSRSRRSRRPLRAGVRPGAQVRHIEAMGAEDRANMGPVLRAMVDGLREDETYVGGTELVLAIEQLAPYTRLTLHVGTQGSHGRRRSRLGAYDFLVLDPALKPTVAPHQVSEGGVDRSVRARSRELQLRRRQLKAAVGQPLGRPGVMG